MYILLIEKINDSEPVYHVIGMLKDDIVYRRSFGGVFLLIQQVLRSFYW